MKKYVRLGGISNEPVLQVNNETLFTQSSGGPLLEIKRLKTKIFSLSEPNLFD